VPRPDAPVERDDPPSPPPPPPGRVREVEAFRDPAPRDDARAVRSAADKEESGASGSDRAPDPPVHSDAQPDSRPETGRPPEGSGSPDRLEPEALRDVPERRVERREPPEVEAERVPAPRPADRVPPGPVSPRVAEDRPIDDVGGGTVDEPRPDRDARTDASADDPDSGPEPGYAFAPQAATDDPERSGSETGTTSNSTTEPRAERDKASGDGGHDAKLPNGGGPPGRGPWDSGPPDGDAVLEGDDRQGDGIDARRRFPIDLLAQEPFADEPGIEGAHVRMKHVGKSDDYLRHRLNTSSIPAASSFDGGLDSAEAAIQHAVDANENAIAEWVDQKRQQMEQGSVTQAKQPEAFPAVRFEEPIGRILHRPEPGQEQPTPSPADRLTVMLRYSDQMPDGFVVFTVTLED
jgi:hypothetical protein